MKSEAKRLLKCGLDLHWLHPKSKRPVAISKWSSLPKKDEAALIREYRQGMNLGVRLGRPFITENKFLAVIDCDVKSTAKIHQTQMREKLAELRIGKTPTVLSGRGNGSQHVYVMTDHPAKAQRIHQSSDLVRVKMGSEPSKKELERLTSEETAAGWRIRPAWEITLMGFGQQVVLPPSIHPDSGLPYRWAAGREMGRIPVAPFTPSVIVGEKGKSNRASVTTEDFKAVEFDLVSSRLSSETVDQILSGDGVEDRSAALLGITCAMLKAGMTDNEILSVLTNRDNYIGGVGYDHTQSSSRKRAAEWIRKFTLEKAKLETLAEYQFEGIEDLADAEELSVEEMELQESDLAPEKDWGSRLERAGKGGEGKLLPSLKNVNLILTHAVAKEVFKRDLFAGTDVYGVEPPWNGAQVHDEVRDIDINNMAHWFVEKYNLEIALPKLYQAVAHVASRSSFHPVRDYLEGLKWDGVPRIDTWLKDYLSAAGPEPYLSAVSRKVLCSMVARVMDPGCKVDAVLILEGSQGVGKSSAVRILAQPWFSDAALDIHDKDATLTMRSNWVMELGELGGIRQAEANALKAFISRQVDRMRTPYGHLAENFPRQSIFIGTTNSNEYLNDPSGNRRIWPVQVGKCDLVGLRRVRDQLLAEALCAYNIGEILYLTQEEDKGAIKEQAKRNFEDEWVGIISDFLKREHDDFDTSQFTMSELIDRGEINIKVNTVGEQMRLAACLRRLAFKSIQKWSNGANRKTWVKSV